jgi:hypothetical protein
MSEGNKSLMERDWSSLHGHVWHLLLALLSPPSFGQAAEAILD